MIRTIPLGMAAIMTAGCMQSNADMSSPGPSSPGAVAVLKSSDGASRGTARFNDGPNGIVVQVQAEGLPAGSHGIHIHMSGRCDAPDFASAGAHWNPTGRQHGRENPQGAHHGDLPNLTIGDDGRGSTTLTTPGGRLAELFDADGAALVIHAAADDHRTDPSGNSGGRIACGIVSPTP